jgi:hypothetical protein
VLRQLNIVVAGSDTLLSGVSAKSALGSTFLHRQFIRVLQCIYLLLRLPAMPASTGNGSAESGIPAPELVAGVRNEAAKISDSTGVAHPSGRSGHGRGMQILRGIAFTAYFTFCCLTSVSPSRPSSCFGILPNPCSNTHLPQ